MKLAMETVNEILKGKMQNLVSFLCQVTDSFETIAEDIECAHLRSAIMALSVESKQYAEEIRNQMEGVSLTAPASDTDELWSRIEKNVHEQAGTSRGSEIAALCNNCEMYFTKLYEDILQEYFPLKKFKDIITYQLYATQCAFMKIRLLNSLRFNS
ncbi:MAG TPA: hypothetical protein VHL77_03430 [Ferruginibacter sp.]|jgi:methionyl-tRNA synthetase|nr:hypothetical protein [Ferruginibacter sp.]